MRSLFGKRKNANASSKPRPNRSPHAVNPKCGLYVTSRPDVALPCHQCAVEVALTGKQCVYSITMSYSVTDPDVDLYFPVSECGNVSSISCRLNGRELHGVVLRSYRGELYSSTCPQFSMEEDGEPLIDKTDTEPTTARKAMPNKKLPKVYQYFAKAVKLQLAGGLPRDSKANLFIEVRTEAIPSTHKERVTTVPFPLTVVSKAPDEFRYKIEMPETIRRCFSPNRSSGLYPFINGTKAEIVVDVSPTSPIHMEDYLFLLQVELGEPIVPQCADPVAILVLVTAVGLVVFFALTRDLEMD